MANLIKIGNVFLNLDRIIVVEDRYKTEKQDSIMLRYGGSENETLSFSGREADDLRTWLNSIAVNLRKVTDLSTEG